VFCLAGDWLRLIPMAKRAGAQITRVKAGHVSLITEPAEVADVILSAAAPTLTAVATTP